MIDLLSFSLVLHFFFTKTAVFRVFRIFYYIIFFYICKQFFYPFDIAPSNRFTALSRALVEDTIISVWIPTPQ